MELRHFADPSLDLPDENDEYEEFIAETVAEGKTERQAERAWEEYMDSKNDYGGDDYDRYVSF